MEGSSQKSISISAFLDLWRRLFPCFCLSLRTRSLIIYIQRIDEALLLFELFIDNVSCEAMF